MLTELCAEVRNYFCKESDIHFGKYEISGGSILPLAFLKEGQYFRIVGSALNDGVYKYPTSELADESFEGAVWAMNVPPSFIALADKIKAFNESETGKPSAYTSESFGGYTYSRATNGKGGVATWRTFYEVDLKKYRRIREI